MSSKKYGFGNENQHLSIVKKVEAEQQRLHQNEQKFKQLESRKQELLAKQQQLQHRLAFVREQVKKEQELENPVMQQLKQHFKALREELRAQAYEDEPEDDDIDIDNMTYQQLLELGETIGKVSKGLSKQKLQALERFVYENELGLQEECTICREQFAEEQECIRLDCKHFFHEDCLKGWVQVEKVCPNCKAEIS